MLTKLIFGLIGMALMVAFTGAIVVKLKEPALLAVVAIGLTMMIVDFIEFLRERD